VRREDEVRAGLHLRCPAFPGRLAQPAWRTRSLRLNLRFSPSDRIGSTGHTPATPWYTLCQDKEKIYELNQYFRAIADGARLATMVGESFEVTLTCPLLQYVGDWGNGIRVISLSGVDGRPHTDSLSCAWRLQQEGFFSFLPGSPLPRYTGLACVSIHPDVS